MDSAAQSDQLLQSPGTLRVATADEPDSGWMPLFFAAFRRSKNPMVLLDAWRRVVEVNGASLQLVGYKRADLIGHHIWEFVIGGPVYSDREWKAALRQNHFTAVGDVRRADGGRVTIEFAAHPAEVTGRRLILMVATTSNRRGRRPSHAPVPDGVSLTLSPRELDVVQLIASGASGPEIAESLQISHNTVRTHVRNSMMKLNTRSQAQLIAKVLGAGVLWADQQ